LDTSEESGFLSFNLFGVRMAIKDHLMEAQAGFNPGFFKVQNNAEEVKDG
jgi:hypothetical protein